VGLKVAWIPSISTGWKNHRIAAKRSKIFVDFFSTFFAFLTF